MHHPNDNPYRVPVAPVSDTTPTTTQSFAAPARRVAAGRGAGWIGEGWQLFKAAPLLWIVVMLLFIVLSTLVQLVPLVGGIAALLIGPSLLVGLYAFAHGIATGEGADINRFFDGFRDRLGPLLLVGLIYGLLIVLLVIGLIVLMFVLGGGMMAGVEAPEQAIEAAANALGPNFLLLMLGFLALVMPVVAAYWFAPALVFYAGLGPLAAMQASLGACLRNWLPFLVYGLLSLLLLLAGILPLLLGLLVVAPLLCASNYASFRDLFGQA